MLACKKVPSILKPPPFDLILVQVNTLDVVFRQIEIVLKDSTAFVYVTKSEKSSHFTLMT